MRKLSPMHGKKAARRDLQDFVEREKVSKLFFQLATKTMKILHYHHCRGPRSEGIWMISSFSVEIDPLGMFCEQSTFYISNEKVSCFGFVKFWLKFACKYFSFAVNVIFMFEMYSPRLPLRFNILDFLLTFNLLAFTYFPLNWMNNRWKWKSCFWSIHFRLK